MTTKEADLERTFRFLTEVAIISQLAGAAFEKRMGPDMTLSQFSVLHHLSRLGGEWAPARLANAMQVTKAAMTNTLGHLGGKNYVAIRPDSRDGRAKLVALTAAGQAARDRAIAAMTPEIVAMLHAVPAASIAEATPLLESVRKHLDQRRG